MSQLTCQVCGAFVSYQTADNFICRDATGHHADSIVWVHQACQIHKKFKTFEYLGILIPTEDTLERWKDR